MHSQEDVYKSLIESSQVHQQQLLLLMQVVVDDDDDVDVGEPGQDIER
jgi:hypothetical protein